MLKLLQVVEITSFCCSSDTISGRRFYALKIIETYLGNTCKQKRLNHLMILLIFYDDTDQLALKNMAAELVCNSEKKISKFNSLLYTKTVLLTIMFFQFFIFLRIPSPALKLKLKFYFDETGHKSWKKI